MSKKSLNVGISSYPCWIYMNGDMKSPPVAARADANCDIFIGDRINTDGLYAGERFENIVYVEFNKKHKVRPRSRIDGKDGFVDPKYYGEFFKTKPGQSPFLK